MHVLRDVSLSVAPKERIVVCGPSGSGKSTMIRCINRLEQHQQGRIVVDGTELTEELGDDKYKGRVAIRMGPVRLQFAGTADITERDEAAKRIVVNAAGAGEKGRGQASMVVTATPPWAVAMEKGRVGIFTRSFRASGTNH